MKISTKYALTTLFVVAFVIIGGVSWWLTARPAQSAPPVLAQIPMPSIVCGKFQAPPLLVGVPVSAPVGGTSIMFSDGYLLQLKAVPSMFIGKRALFQIADGVVINYGLVEEAYNPCPAKP